jgi:hypothetical protein
VKKIDDVAILNMDKRKFIKAVAKFYVLDGLSIYVMAKSYNLASNFT